MKYCSKCGNELLDEAVICPKCGCATEPPSSHTDKLIAENRRSKLATGSILNNIAAILNIILAGVFTYLLFFYEGEQSTPDSNLTISGDGTVTLNPGGLPNSGAFFVWVVLIIAIFVVGLLISRIKNKSTQKLCGYLYIVLTIAALIIMNVAFPNLVALLMCVWGIIFFVPTLLQLIAGVKFLQGAYKG